MDLPTFLSSTLENLLRDAKAQVVTEIFLLLTIVSLLMGLWATYTNRAPRFVNYAPALLTSLGILGTFVGIIVGLMHFDSAHIDQSISQLLDGLKTAFITSLAGIGSAIVFKLLTTTFIVAPPRPVDDVTEAGPEDLLQALRAQQHTLQNLHTALASPDDASLISQLRRWRADQRDQHQILLTAVTELRTVLAGSEETSLVGQLKLLRNDEHDRHRETLRALYTAQETRQHFAERFWPHLDTLAATLGHIQTALAAPGETSLSDQLQRLQSDHSNHHQALLQALDDLRAVIAGTEDTSLVNEWRGLRDDAQRRYTELLRTLAEDRTARDQFAAQLWQHLDRVGEMLSKAATEQMMNALREVIADFNKNLTEQFGDNFRALDASVQKLVEWQDRYRQQLEQMITQYAQGVSAITTIEAAVGHIAVETQHIPATMAQLKDVLQVNQHQIQELGRHLEAFQAMRDRAIEAVPQIREQIDQTVNAIAAAVQKASEHYTKLLELSDAYIEAHNEKTHQQLDAFIKTTDRGINRVREGLDSGATAVEQTLIQSAQTFNQDLQTLHGRLEKTAEHLTDHGNALYARLEEGLNQVHQQMQEMAKGLAEQFKGLATTLTATSDQMQKHLEKAVTDAVQTASDHYTKLLDLSDAYIEAHDEKTHEQLDAFIKTTDRGINRVREGLDSGATAVEQTLIHSAQTFTQHLQTLHGRLETTAEQLTAHGDALRARLQDALNQQQRQTQEMLKALAEQFQGLSSTLTAAGEQAQRDTRATQEQVATSIGQMQKRLESALEETATAQSRAVQRAVDGVLEEMRKAVSRTGEGVNQQLAAIDQAMQQEMNRVLNEMGRALAQITGQFTADYRKLVQAMQQIVNESERPGR